MTFFNFAINFWSSNKQTVSAGVPPEIHAKFVTRLDETLDRLSLTEEQKTQAFLQLAKSQSELEAIVKVVSGFLNAIYREEIPPDQYTATFFRLTQDWETAGARIDALGKSANLALDIEARREAAQKAHAAGDTAEAVRLLNEIDAEELENERRLLEQQRAITAEIQRSRQSRIATKEAQIPLAFADLRHREAARLIAERIDLSEEDPGKRLALLSSEFMDFYERGRDRGLNADLQAAIEIARLALPRARDSDERGSTQNNLGNALSTLGQREPGTERLLEAVEAYRNGLKEMTRERVPLDWAMTQNNLGDALTALGKRESGTARLEEAVDAFRAVLTERTRERVPLQWATTQTNLGNALTTLGERENGTARLEEGADAYRAALEEFTRERVPLDWATTQSNLGNALTTLGERENGTARLEEAVDAYRAALAERTRERVPLDWAATQNNLGTALQTLGERENRTARLEEAVDAFRAALTERTRERVPLDWAATQNNLGNALQTLGDRQSGTARLEEAVDAYRAAIEEFTRERVPLQWAATQNNLGYAQALLNERLKSLRKC
jgi:tetratricopeptide (TPR) repeat protein